MSNKPHACPHCDLIFQWGQDADSAIVESFGARIGNSRTNAYWKLRCHIAESHFEEGFLCPRRRENPQIAATMPGKDWWDKRDKTCSYCGSVSVEELFEAINSGIELVPTNKNYKVYIGPARRTFYFPHLSKEQQDLFINTVNMKLVKIAHPGHFYVLPYFMVKK